MYLARVIVIKKVIKQKTVSFRQFLNNVLSHTFYKEDFVQMLMVANITILRAIPCSKELT